MAVLTTGDGPCWFDEKSGQSRLNFKHVVGLFRQTSHEKNLKILYLGGDRLESISELMHMARQLGDNSMDASNRWLAPLAWNKQESVKKSFVPPEPAGLPDHKNRYDFCSELQSWPHYVPRRCCCSSLAIAGAGYLNAMGGGVVASTAVGRNRSAEE
ncbi:hypothetical protein NPIL_309251 [Nephila pilipes]|uniref:Uncharacterized protein n=1 Tax=Nephila pilipes TaxID=299642 RepID=A0A8X6TNP6_NEPPI|nr:hypothetical protein NPIL_309251 [Nephila pilipes]